MINTSYPIGSKNLDNLFGGYAKGVLHCFFGPTGSGKTTLSVYSPIASIYKAEKANLTDKHKFFVIDGDGGFDAERATACWEANGLDPDKVMKYVQTWEPTDFAEQHKIFSGGRGNVPGELETFINKEGYKPLLIAADPMVAIYRGIVMRTDSAMRAVVLGSYTAKLDLQMATMKQLSKTTNCPSIITSWPSSPIGAAMSKETTNVSGEVPILGGRSFGFIPKIIVELRIERDRATEQVTKRTAILFKHRARKAGTSCNYSITDKGVSD